MSQYEFWSQIVLTWLLSGSEPGSQGNKHARTIPANDSECAS
jgi:hypothetical protein